MGRLYLRVTYRLKEGLREAFLENVKESGILFLIRAEEGCVEYGYCIPVDSTDTLVLFEVWESESLQQKHLKQPHMKILKDLKERYVEETRLDKLSEWRS